MGYERNDRRNERDQGYGQGYGREPSYGRDRYGASRSGYGAGEQGRYESQRYGREARDYGRPPQGYDEEDRGFFDRAGDEVRSWFGDDEAERRRREDERRDERDYRGNYAQSGGRGAGRSEDRGYGVASGGGSGGFGGSSGSGYGSSFGAGDYGAGFGAGATGSWGLGAGNDRSSWGQDPTYRSWRDRQLESFDRDYEDYRREHQSKFDNEFHSWRQGRQGQRDALNKVQEHQEVVGSDGQHVGKVDKVRGDRIILTKSDQDAGGHHHSIPSAWIKSVDDKVTISKTAEEAKSHWRDEERNSAFGSGSDQSQQTGARNLNRSFSGTY